MHRCHAKASKILKRITSLVLAIGYDSCPYKRICLWKKNNRAAQFLAVVLVKTDSADQIITNYTQDLISCEDQVFEIIIKPDTLLV